MLITNNDFLPCGFETWPAVFSRCTKYRYWLRRDFEDMLAERGPAVFVMHNPSTADHLVNDPTVERCVRYAKRWRCAGCVVVNRFAIRGTDPSVVWNSDDPVGPLNDAAIAAAARTSVDLGGPIVVAWGAFHGRKAEHRVLVDRRADAVASLIIKVGAEPTCLSVTAGGEPRHPLYLRSDLVPVPWR